MRGVDRAGSSGGSGARHRLTLVFDPRFPGGTAAAIAEEVRALRCAFDLRLAAIETGMFKDRAINPRLRSAIEEVGLALDWNPRVIRGDTVVVHNPACLKFEPALKSRISAGAIYVVAHENFLRPGGAEGFDVAHCLDLVRRASVTGRLVLAPVSAPNRRGVRHWLARSGLDGWELAPFDWTNICNGVPAPPSPAPRDRRGRHSRPGPEKFPRLETMRAHFPRHAERCVILGGDAYLRDPARLPPHWRVLPFGAVPVERFLKEIDFFVYFTNALWRESFGRAIAEATAAGKLVITDPATAEAFGPGVVASDGSDVDAIIRRHLVEPEAYAARVREAQARLAEHRPERVRRLLLRHLTSAPVAAPAFFEPDWPERERRHAPV